MEYVKTKEQWYNSGVFDGYKTALEDMKKRLNELRIGSSSQEYEYALDDMEYELDVLGHG